MTKFKLIWTNPESKPPEHPEEETIEGPNINQALLDYNYPFGSLEDLHHYEEIKKEEECLS